MTGRTPKATALSNAAPETIATVSHIDMISPVALEVDRGLLEAVGYVNRQPRKTGCAWDALGMNKLQNLLEWLIKLGNDMQ